MKANTLVVIDYDTQKTPSVIETLSGTYDILFVAFSRLPELPVAARGIISTIVLCLKPDAAVLHQLTRLRNARPELPIVLMSPQPPPADVARAMQAGATHYLDLAADDNPLSKWLYDEAIRRRAAAFSFWDFFPQWFHRFKPKIPVNALNSVENNVIPLPNIPFVEPLPSEGTPQYRDDFLDVKFFGEFILALNGRVLKPKKNAALLAYLLFNHDKPLHRDQLIAKFWGDSTHESARNCLNAAIFSIRKMLAELTDGRRIIIYERDFYAIDTAAWYIETDADRFARHWEKARLLHRTQGLTAATSELQTLRTIYSGAFLGNTHLDWCVGKRDEFSEKHLQALNWLAEAFWQQKNYMDCIELCNDILAIDDCVEITHQRLMHCYAALKMTEKAVRQFQKCVEALKRMRAQPSAETQKLYADILLPLGAKAA